ncbi:MAG: hypothetical protein ACMVO3_19330 [Thalassobaculum sp.]
MAMFCHSPASISIGRWLSGQSRSVEFARRVLPEENAGIPQVLVPARQRVVELFGVEGGEVAQERLPDRPDPSFVVIEFVGDAGQPPIGIQKAAPCGAVGSLMRLASSSGLRPPA